MSPAERWFTRLGKARLKIGTLARPGFGYMTVVALSAFTAYKINQATGLNDWIRLRIAGGASPWMTGSWEWCPTSPPSIARGTTGNYPAGGSASTFYWFLRATSNGGTGGACAGSPITLSRYQPSPTSGISDMTARGNVLSSWQAQTPGVIASPQATNTTFTVVVMPDAAIDDAMIFDSIRPATPTDSETDDQYADPGEWTPVLTQPLFDAPTAQEARDTLLGDPNVALELGRILDPAWEGEPFEWLPAQPLESYEAYVTRLRAAGWLGTATKMTLGPANGDPEYGASGVPCTSVAAGAQIGAGTGVAIYENPAIFGSDDPNPGQPACTGRLATSKDTRRCSFFTVAWAVKSAENRRSTMRPASRHGNISGTLKQRLASRGQFST